MSDQTYQPEQSVFPEWRSFLGKSRKPETQSFIKQVVKRNGALEYYDRRKFENDIGKEGESVE
ncbi:MAG: hypothetical protein K2M90_03920, partial [Treponemataceae bacterium]|nr:hypothetical protein [Treponemataceae bacterium]